jgi:multicomponent Na+:H+ antiporter subunit G
MTAVEGTVVALTIVLSSIGAFFFFAGTLGMLRLPDFYCRTHAATKCDTVGAGSVLLALAVFNGFAASTAKILVLAVLILLTSPTSGHALARAAYRTGLLPWLTPESRPVSDKGNGS